MIYGTLFNNTCVVKANEKGDEYFVSPKVLKWTLVTREFEELGIGLYANRVVDEKKALEVAKSFGVKEEDFYESKEN